MFLARNCSWWTVVDGWNSVFQPSKSSAIPICSLSTTSGNHNSGGIYKSNSVDLLTFVHCDEFVNGCHLPFTYILLLAQFEPLPIGSVFAYKLNSISPINFDLALFPKIFPIRLSSILPTDEMIALIICCCLFTYSNTCPKLYRISSFSQFLLITSVRPQCLQPVNLLLPNPHTPTELAYNTDHISLKLNEISQRVIITWQLFLSCFIYYPFIKTR